MPRGIALALLVGLALGLAACASTTTEDGQPRESSIPWNRPASWEGAGVYGSAINPAQ
jgi:hypothetical protein